jgi:mono/diheme cytochrome c family protein
MAQRGWGIAGKVLTTLLVAGMAIAAVAAFQIVKHGVSARDKPTAAEGAIAGALRHFAVPRDARAMKNPVVLTDAVLAEGRAHWADHCAACHGNDGKGDTEVGRGLYPKVPDMSDGSDDLSDGELFYIITNGVRLTGMPGWGDPRNAQSSEQTWHLVHFIRHLPKITPAELEQMKQMSPISPMERKEKKDEDEFLSGDDHKSPTPR